METLEQILEMWKKDSEIDQTEPGRELLNIPKLHNKYLHILSGHRIASKKCNFEYYKMKKIKWEYYSGKMSQEELTQRGWEPFRYTLKTDISIYLDSDPMLQELVKNRSYHEEAIVVVESIMGELKSRTFQLKDFISWEKFIGGQ